MMVVETLRASAKGSGPREETQAAKAVPKHRMITANVARMRTGRRFFLSSWPGLSRPSTSFSPATKVVDARAKPGHDDGEFGSFLLISPGAPQPSPCRCGRS